MNLEEEKVFNDLFQEMHEMLCNYALKNLDNPAAAEDVVQDTFLLACARVDELCGHPNPRGWLVQVLKNNIKNFNRRMKTVTTMLSNVPLEIWLANYPVDGGFDDDLELLYGDLAKTKEYELLKKYAVERYSMAELAREYGISINCCKQRILRARLKLKNLLK